ncbi:MAG TPA: alpha/beta hydrolase [Acidimicrobiia bacterium]|nr:alpha/beta hydrolase [Acidimicrobiia bacterium]
MTSIPTLDGIAAGHVSTDRITTRILFSGPTDGIPVLFLHGNHSSATWWEDNMLNLPVGYRAIAPDMRGFGEADPSLKIDATRGCADWGEDVLSLMDHLGYETFHLVGSSLGGNVGWWLVVNAGSRLRSFIGVCPGSPIGFGGTKDAEGTPCWDDFAGGGAGLLPPPFVEAIRNGDDTADTPFSPRAVFRARTWETPPEREDAYIDSLLQIHLGDDAYPGDVTPSENWPFVAPGVWGPNNAIACKYGMKPDEIASADPKPPIAWVRGANDLSVSNAAAADIGTHGPSGIVPGWPGADIYPPQPMLDQIRLTLDRYTANGGETEEIVMEDCGHAPFVERPEEFDRILHGLLGRYDAVA